MASVFRFFGIGSSPGGASALFRKNGTTAPHRGRRGTVVRRNPRDYASAGASAAAAASALPPATVERRRAALPLRSRRK